MPLQVAASNELPESEELDALYDRFLIRRQVSLVSNHGLRQLLQQPHGRSSNCQQGPCSDPTRPFKATGQSPQIANGHTNGKLSLNGPLDKEFFSEIR